MSLSLSHTETSKTASSKRGSSSSDEEQETTPGRATKKQRPKHDTNNELLSDVLSRSTLYAPLQAYNQTKIDPGLYLTQIRNIPSSIKEKSVIEFCYDISSHFHSTVKGLSGKNTAARPMDRPEISSSLQLRGLTLVGGGFQRGTNNNKKNNIPKKDEAIRVKQCQLLKQKISHDKQQRKKRRRKKRKEKVPNDEKQPQDDQTCIPEFDSFDIEQQHSFLKQLNDKWIDYASKIVSSILLQENNNQIGGGKKKRKSFEPKNINVAAMLSMPIARMRMTNEIEWVGSTVQIQSCPAQCGYEGRTGILVASTDRTWKVIVRNESSSKKTKKNQTSTSSVCSSANMKVAKDDGKEGMKTNMEAADAAAAATEPKTACNKQHQWGYTVLVVPKQNASLVVKIPLSTLNKQVVERMNVDNQKDETENEEKHLCFVLKNI